MGVQNFIKMDNVYGKETAQSMRALCDTWVDLGVNDVEVTKQFVEMIGKHTIAEHSVSKTGGRNKSSSHSDQVLGRELLTVDELDQIPRTHVFVKIAQFAPIVDKKYNLERDPNYKYIDPGHERPAYGFRYNGRTITMRWWLPSIRFTWRLPTISALALHKGKVYGPEFKHRYGLEDGKVYGLHLGPRAVFKEPYRVTLPERTHAMRDSTGGNKLLSRSVEAIVDGGEAEKVSVIRDEYLRREPYETLKV
jgi:hypothetical protein